MSRLPSYLGQADALPAFTEEVKQAVPVRLLVCEEGLVPRIASYWGRGSLAVWQRMAATRLEVTLSKSERPPPPADEDRSSILIRCSGVPRPSAQPNEGATSTAGC
jgi:hypothetical protein